ncbi:MAG: DUF1294 domain-containing protein [Limisphaerales bacterium]
MNLQTIRELLLAWVGVTSLWAFLLFGLDKWRAGRTGARRVAESSLLLASALGGWPGGLLGIVLFRHKLARQSFQFKFAAAFVVWAALIAGALKLTRVI